MSKKTQICTCCGKSKPLNDYYFSNSPFNQHLQCTSVCKECIWNYVEANGSEIDLDKIIDGLRMIDKPFLADLWETSLRESERNGKHPFKNYMKNIGLPQKKVLNWNDSDFDGFSGKPKITDVRDYNSEFQIDEEIVKYWGRVYEDWEYEFLENERMKLMASFECPDYGMEMLMKDICFINLEIEKLRQEKRDNHKAIGNLIETRRNLMNDAKMKPIQAIENDGNDQVTFGTLIKKWENERPLPQPLDDEIIEYINTFMIGHLAKMEGLNNELTQKYEDALSRYTIDFDEIERNQDENIED